MSNITVLRTERNGVEFFTIAATGESGMSQSGLARACGKDQSTISRLIEALSGKKSSKTLKPSTYKGFAPSGKFSLKKLNPSVDKDLTLMQKVYSKWLQPFTGKDLTLMRDHSSSDSKTRNVTVYTAEFCAAVIKHYAYSGSETAQDFDFSLGIIGLTSYIQSQTGWLPKEFKAAPKEHDKLDEFLGLAMEWDRGPMMVVDWEGEVDMSDSWTFFDAIVFSGFTPEEFILFEDETRELGLQKHSKSEQVKLFFKRNPEIEERQKPYTENVRRMLRLPKNSQLFRMTFLDEYGCNLDNLYSKLETSASALRIYRLGYADRTQYADPQYPYSRNSDYLEGWNANISVSQ